MVVLRTCNLSKHLCLQKVHYENSVSVYLRFWSKAMLSNVGLWFKIVVILNQAYALALVVQ